MRKFTLCLLSLFMCISNFVSGQACTGDFTFNTQTALDQFLIDNPTCTSVVGNVYLEISDATDPIMNLNGLQNIALIDGDFFIVYNGSGNVAANLPLTALSSLTQVTGFFYLQDKYDSFLGAPRMTSLAGLENLTSLGLLSLSTCQGITSLDVLSGLTTLGGLSVYQCDNLTYTNLFPLVSAMPLGIHFSGYYNANMNPISGFDALVSVGEISFGNGSSYQTFGNIDAFHNLISAADINFSFVGVETISAFENLQNVTGSLHIELIAVSLPDFPMLTFANNIIVISSGDQTTPFNTPEFNALLNVGQSILLLNIYDDVSFPALQTIGGELNIQGYWMGGPFVNNLNAGSLLSVAGNFTLGSLNLSDLSTLSNLQNIGGMVNVYGNSSLSNCSVQALCDKLNTAPEMVTIEYNLTGCNSPAEVAAGCTFSYASGLIFADLDCDGVYNNADAVIPNAIVHDQNGMPVGASYTDGTYLLPFADNTTTTFSAVAPSGFDAQNTYTVTATAVTSIYPNYNFAMCPQPDYHNVSVSLNGSVARRGFQGYYSISVTNLGAYVEQASVVLDLNSMPGLNVVNANGGSVFGNTVTWTIASIGVFQTAVLELIYMIDQSTPLGTLYHPTVTVEITPSSILDLDLSDNSSAMNQTVMDSYDPNVKSVNREAINVVEISNGESVELVYTIHFQNTGNAPAINVRVRDEIADNLDLSTFQMLTSSHSCALSFDDNNRVEWLFENINLPDSASDPLGSQGFVQFKIKSVESLTLDAIIQNAASIFFDFNAPVVTNTANTIFYTCPSDPVITGVTSVCAGENIVLSASSGWSSYVWSLGNAEIGNQNVLQFATTTVDIYHFILTAATDFCDANATFDVDVHAIPDSPVVTQTGNVLSASGTGEFTWTLNGNVLASTANTISITESGNYGVTVQLDGCVSDPSTGNYDYTGMDELTKTNLISIAPNPMRTSSIIKLNGGIRSGLQLTIADATGRIVFESGMTSSTMVVSKDMLASGLYYVKVYSRLDGTAEVMKLVVE